METPEEFPADESAPSETDGEPTQATDAPTTDETEAELTDAHTTDETDDTEATETVADASEEPVEQAPEVAARADEPVEVDPALAAEVEEALEGVEEDEVVAVPEWVPGDWYVVHTYAGYENKVKADLETRVSSMNMEESIYEIVIPMEEVVEIKNGKKQTVQRKVFPGYLLVRMDLNDDSWYVVRNTPGVTGFVGSGNKPIPLSEREVDKILRRKEEAERAKPKAEWNVNDPVRVTTGPFANFQGTINEVDDERQKVKVLVNIFGRETPVELSYDQISKV